MNDMRKWINLLNEESRDHWLQSDDGWYSDEDVSKWFPVTGAMGRNVQGDWFELLDRKDPNKELFIAQDFFQKHVLDEYKPAWISDMKIEDEEDYFWKIERGEDDPDE